MYCITSLDCEFDKKYLAFQNTDDEIRYGYYLTDKETFMMNLSNNKKEHPTIFKTEEQVVKFIKWLELARNGFAFTGLSYEWIDDGVIPTCDMNCQKCNKKKKYSCKHLRNPYQNYCGFHMAKFEDGFSPDEKRLDAPCEKCLTKGCAYNMNYSY